MNPATALSNPFSVVLSQSTAQKYFGYKDPIGKKLKLLNNIFEVTGIIEDSPEYSHIHIDIMPSYLSLKGFGGSYNIKEDYFLGGDNFTDNVTYTYARIATNADPNIIYSKIPALLDRNIPPVTSGNGTTKKVSALVNIGFRNIKDIHIRDGGDTEIEPTTDSAYITIFTLVAVFILIIACVNFINLSTARGAKRAKEVGLRTVAGATRSSLITQFIGESVFLSFLSLILAIILVILSLPYFETFIGTDLSFNILKDPFILIILISIFLTAGIISGLYPAFYMSSFNSAAMMELFGYFSVLALIIGCLGLLGLASFTTEQKIKEIGIRKTLGASVGNITFNLSYQFTQWVFIANLIALPIVYFYMNDWLNNFAYRTNIEISVFVISITISLVIALVTVASQIIKVAMQNPVIALRTE